MILDSGFCVLQGIIKLRKLCVFAGALIKKRCYWPKNVPGDAIDEYFKDKEVREVDLLKGTLDDITYNILCMKEPDYVMKIMSTYEGLLENDCQKVPSGKTRLIRRRRLRY